MTYGLHGFYPFHLWVFHVKIVVSLWLIYCYLVAFVVLASLIIEPILAHKEGKVIFLESYILIIISHILCHFLYCFRRKL